MSYIKKLVMHGFKSFPKKTEIPFDKGINVILGPNGSGKSNLSDALCFVLGRLGIKSMRAARASNLIFLGSKVAPPAKEASVEIIFDNSEKTFSIESNEISIKRIVRRNGQSIYRINHETKTRQEVLMLLAQAGIDPNGFNIILQGEIQNFVRMHTEERRKIIEEVSGISVYEIRRERSLNELDKTEERLKEVLAILRERTAHLNNLEKERQQALKFKKIEEDIKKFRASIINYDLIKKKKESEEIKEQITKKEKEIEKIKNNITKIKTNISNLESQIASINESIQKASGLEQEKLNSEIANLRAELAGLSVKFENQEKRIAQLSKQKQDLNENIRNIELQLKELQRESPSISKKNKEVLEKKQELEKLEAERKKFYITKSELKSLKDRIQDKHNVLQTYQNESNFVLKQIENISIGLFDKKTDLNKVQELKVLNEEKKEELNNLNKKEIEIEKIIHTNEFEINRQNNVIEKISKMDICPLCKSKITKEHLHDIHKEILPIVDLMKKAINESKRQISEIQKIRNKLKTEINELTSEISKREYDLIKLRDIENKKEQIKNLQEKIDAAKNEISEFEKRRKSIENNFDENSGIEHKYEVLRIDLQEVSLRTDENVDAELTFKERELERSKIVLKQVLRDEEEIKEEFEKLKVIIKNKEELVEKKKKQEAELVQKFQKMIVERDGLQQKIRVFEAEQMKEQNNVYNVEQDMNNFKILKAKSDAELENFEIEMLEFKEVEVIKGSKEFLTERLNHLREIFSNIGTVNLKSLEVYDSVKQDYDSVKDKVDIITKEKESVMRIIQEIDIKKKKTFLKTLDLLNEKFSRNFSQLSIKGQVYLELENKKEPFEEGVNIIVKTGHGKYFDVTSLSGGEQTLVALSLIFAIQELKPYYFYILDEIDAALDKRNSERLSQLLKKYMERGQYIIITHNDEVISNATNLYGVSMHDGISKIISLKF